MPHEKARGNSYQALRSPTPAPPWPLVTGSTPEDQKLLFTAALDGGTQKPVALHPRGSAGGQGWQFLKGVK